jgi:hypothetical protein
MSNYCLGDSVAEYERETASNIIGNMHNYKTIQVQHA